MSEENKEAVFVCSVDGYVTVAPGRTVGKGTKVSQSSDPKMFSRIKKACAFTSSEGLVCRKRPFLLVNPTEELLELEEERLGGTLDSVLERRAEELKAEAAMAAQKQREAEERIALMKKKREERNALKDKIKEKRRRELEEQRKAEEAALLEEVDKELEDEDIKAVSEGKKPSGRKTSK